MGEKKVTSIGGQAVIEGVMMRGPHKTAVAVRKPDGEIIIDEKETKGIGKWAKIPIVRGCVSFVSSMVVGVQALMFSAKFFDVEEEEKTKKEKNKNEGVATNADQKKEKFKKNKNVENDDTNINSEKKNRKDKKDAEVGSLENQKEENKVQKEKKEESIPEGLLYLSVLLAVGMSVGLFIVLPNAVSNLFVPNRESNPVIYNLVESIVKIIIFLGYLLLVSQMKDIQRTFEYHGAEHKTIFCYENGEELTPENVKKYSRFHPRCGTSFLLFVVIISIIVFSIVGVYENAFVNMGLRLLLLPLVAGISYEIIKFAGKSTSKCVTWLNAPGKWLQRLTTREPDESQIEVAIASLKAVIPENKDDDRW